MTDERDAGEMRTCPFCGGEYPFGEYPLGSCDPKLQQLIQPNDWWRVMCYQCGASVSHPERDEAVKNWNRRPAPSPQPVANERDVGEMLENAWIIICNAYAGDWKLARSDWRYAAERFRGEYHAWLDAHKPRTEPAPNPLPVRNSRRRAMKWNHEKDWILMGALARWLFIWLPWTLLCIAVSLLIWSTFR